MSLSGSHMFGSIEETRVTFVEKGVSEERKDFLKKLLEHNDVVHLGKKEPRLHCKLLRRFLVPIVLLAMVHANDDPPLRLRPYNGPDWLICRSLLLLPRRSSATFTRLSGHESITAAKNSQTTVRVA